MKRKAKVYRNKVVTANNKPKRNKKGGCMVKRAHLGAARSEEVPKIDLAHQEAQTAALLSELALQPVATIGKRLKCKMGKHGDTARLMETKWIDGNGKQHTKYSSIDQYYCVSCGGEWQEDAERRRERREREAYRRMRAHGQERTKSGPSSW